jgi:hypothetical protein
MKDNPTIDNDLQKAIDDITNNTNNDPVFGDPIAAPAPAPIPPKSAPMPPKPAPVAPRPNSFSEVGMPPAPKPVAAPVFKPAPAPIPPKPIAAPAPAPMPPKPIEKPAPIEEPDFIEETATEEIVSEQSPELHNVKEAILRDLAPMVDRINMDPSEKFNLYKEIHEELHDDSVIASAYEVSKEITDDDERADALLYLYDSLK